MGYGQAEELCVAQDARRAANGAATRERKAVSFGKAVAAQPIVRQLLPRGIEPMPDPHEPFER